MPFFFKYLSCLAKRKKNLMIFAGQLRYLKKKGI